MSIQIELESNQSSFGREDGVVQCNSLPNEDFKGLRELAADEFYTTPICDDKELLNTLKRSRSDDLIEPEVIQRLFDNFDRFSNTESFDDREIEETGGFFGYCINDGIFLALPALKLSRSNDDEFDTDHCEFVFNYDADDELIDFNSIN